MNKPKLIIFASGSKTGGGSGFENLVRASRDGILDAEILTVISNHENGGVREKADRLGIPFVHFNGPWAAEQYQEITKDADYVALSGWLKLVVGLNPRTTFNIHPGPLPRFGGTGMYGHHVHEAVMEAYHRGEVTHSAVSMHFVTEKYDEGPIFFSMPVEILPNDTAETLALRVNQAEHKYQPIITNYVVHGIIFWDGVNPESLKTIT
ncbi:MAG: formyltransferase family protein [Candidatus Zambryskibacteria bacterium]|nr:formyltransferase family protein [Candidatus Zambryskibacteria bacterium]